MSTEDRDLPDNLQAHRYFRATLIVTLVAFALRAAVALWLHPEPAWDGVLYERGARALARSMGYVTFMFEQRASDTVPTAFYPVGYPAFVGLLYKLFGERLAVLHGAGVVVSTVSVTLAHRVALGVAKPRAAHASALAYALLPGSVLFAPTAMTEPLFGFLLVLALWLLVTPLALNRIARATLFGVTLAAATYVRPQAIVLAPLLPLFAFGRHDAIVPTAGPLALAKAHIQRAMVPALIATLTALALIAPWSYRNCRVLDGCALVSTNGGSNLAIGAVPRANGRYFALNADDGCRGVVGETARDRCWRAVARASIAQRPAHFGALALVKLDHTLSYEAFPLGYLRVARAITLTDAQEKTLRRAITGPWRLFLLLALLACIPWRDRPPLAPAARAALAACLTLLATHMVFFGGDRYHLPLIPLMVPLVAASLRGVRAWFAPSVT
ncbi:MAG: hypothetical protein Q8Q09_14625 [Deltaproteobacteria bacterium]|nr:hypothetical protein [Deltaproteobacteria bacterium]